MATTKASVPLKPPYCLLARDELDELPVAEAVEVELALPSATLTPKLVPVTTLVAPPFVVVVVYVTVAVVVASHAVHEVHGAFESQVPDVQPVHVESGQAFPPHHLVQAPETHEPEEPHGPHPPPKGPKPGPQAPVDQGPLVVHAELAVAENVASGAAVTVWPASAQS